ncbi:hypothetical protein LGL55_10490 [Clostridium tagluense]|uniref:hypothetical protein n=1 Tax=Clostridium tagluense TaxID=360422 RepID=UPI001CF500FF|nr:hypothetical protein [Clostridium tagluense]MCB2300636.1 hypothetical protein [Clostridium tagluense]MCB2311633.1 hypothetical protein [Clostridium tagluense]MCB2316357.1 hypothetical protein [Clostridium tagluense]MCB2321259.1 hypothetical protein [Clostridium tagluense]MCB2326226.1 hypothetical protein [Clostridium tagluense]
MNKLMEAIVEMNTKGSLQTQANRLADEEYCYKKLINEYNDRIDEIDEDNDEELFENLWLMKEKYKVRLEDIKKEMCYLNKRIIETFGVIEEYLEFDLFIETFGLNEDEVDSDESFYDNLLCSSEKIGHVCRVGLIYCEKVVHKMLD